MKGGKLPLRKSARLECTYPRLIFTREHVAIVHHEARNARRQRLTISLWESGPRPVLEALLEVEAGHVLLRTAPPRCDYCGSMLGAMNPWDWPGRPDGIWLHLELARAEALAGNTVGAENYYQHAEHYFRSMSSDRGAT